MWLTISGKLYKARDITKYMKIVEKIIFFINLSLSYYMHASKVDNPFLLGHKG